MDFEEGIIMSIDKEKIIKMNMEFRMVEAHLKRMIDILEFPSTEEMEYIKVLESKFDDLIHWYWYEDK